MITYEHLFSKSLEKNPKQNRFSHVIFQEPVSVKVGCEFNRFGPFKLTFYG